MLKRALLAAIAASSWSMTANAETLFRGTLQFTSANAACTQGPSAGDISNGQFHPAVLGNDNFAALNAIFNFGAVSWRLLAPGSFTSTFQQVDNSGIGWAAYAPPQPSFLRVTKQTPGTLEATTLSVTLVGQIKNPFGNDGQAACTAGFLFVGVKTTG